MAKKKKAMSTPGAAPKPAVAQVKIVVDMPEGSEPYYANHVEVGHTKFDFFLLCSRLPTKPSSAVIQSAVASGELHIPATVQVTFPASLIAGLIRALETQKQAFEKDAGPIPDLGAGAPKAGAGSNDKPTKKIH